MQESLLQLEKEEAARKELEAFKETAEKEMEEMKKQVRLSEFDSSNLLERK